MVLGEPFQNKNTSILVASYDPGDGWVVGKVKTRLWCCKHAKGSSSFQEDLERGPDLSGIRGWFWSTSLEQKPDRKKVPRVSKSVDRGNEWNMH